MFKYIFSFFKQKEKQQDVVLAANSTNYSGYLINDPSTPDLTANVEIPSVGLLRFNVRDMNSSPKNKREQQSLNCFVTIANCINFVQKNSKIAIKKWSATQELQVIPQAGKDLNAYYDRSSLKFFYYPVRGKTMFTSDSSDVVSHELGHALLDAIRPDFWSVQSLEIWSFHEGFSDICSIVSAMQYDVLLNRVLSQTNNDISISSNLSRLAEEFGIAVYNLGGSRNGSLPNCLRDPAIQKFKYVNPSTLPSEAPDNKLCAECHSFGRVFSSAWYQLLVEIYKKELLNNAPIVALKNARDISFSILLQAIPSSPRVVEYFSAIAKSMVSVTKIKYPQYSDVVQSVFSDCNIIKPQIKILSNTTYQDLVVKLNKNDEVIKNSKHTIVKLVENKTIKLNLISILSNNKLNDVEIEVASDKYYEFDSSGNLVDEIYNNDDEILESSKLCIQNVEKELDKMWSVQDGKLVRNYIV